MWPELLGKPIIMFFFVFFLLLKSPDTRQHLETLFSWIEPASLYRETRARGSAYHYVSNKIKLFNFSNSQAHPPGAINVQIYRLIKEWTAWDIARRAAFAFFGIFSGTEENPEFMQGMLQEQFLYAFLI